MGNYSRNPDAVLQDALAKGYDTVRFQQGKPILDRELNLLGDLAGARRLAPYIGNGVPAVGGLRAEAPPTPAYTVDFALSAGRCLVGGMEVVLPARVGYMQQPHKENLQFIWPFTPASTTTTTTTSSSGTQTLSDTIPPPPVPAGGTGYVYLRVFRTEADDTTDPTLRNQQDIGFETALRSKVDWELLLLAAPTAALDHFLLAEYYVTPVTVTTGGGTESFTTSKTTDTSTTSTKSTTTSAKFTTTGTESSSFSQQPPPDPGPLPDPGTTYTQYVVTSWTDRRVIGLTLAQVRAELSALSASLNPDGSPKANVVTNTALAGGAVTQNKIANGAVSYRQLDAGKLYDTTFSLGAGVEGLYVVAPAAANRLLMTNVTTTTNPTTNSVTWNEWCGFNASATDKTVPWRGIMVKNRGSSSVDVRIMVYELRNVS
jgi:hypothetical protein